MDGERSPLTDSALDREIAAALDVEPSAAFLARVRSRVADEPIAAPWYAGWRIPALVTATAAIVAGAALWPAPPVQAPRVTSHVQPPSLADSGRPPTGGEQTRAADVGVSAQRDAAIAARGRRTRPELSPSLEAAASVTPVVNALPLGEVLIDPREAAALRRLFGRGSPDAVPQLAASAYYEPLTAIEQIAVAPVTVPPLTWMASE